MVSNSFHLNTTCVQRFNYKYMYNSFVCTIVKVMYCFKVWIKPSVNLIIIQLLFIAGGCCVSHRRAYNQTLKLFESEYSENHLIVYCSDWTDYNDAIIFQDYKYHCMIANGCFILYQNQSILNNNMAMSAWVQSRRARFRFTDLWVMGPTC